MPTDELDDAQKFDIEDKLANEYDSITIFPSDSDFDGHYSHYCKTILWPVFHYQIPDNPKSKAYEDHSWVYYVKINQAFADRIVKSWKRGDVIVINDYHLLLVPSMLRKKLPDTQIGFFMHVAFPSSEVFRCLAVRKELLEGLLGANLIGFQTQEYCHHFLQTCNRLLCVEATADGVQLEDRFVNVATFPIGIDPESLSERRAEPEVLEWLERLKAKYTGLQLIVARDKLDHVRGVRQKLLAYELFLNKYPEMKEKVSKAFPIVTCFSLIRHCPSFLLLLHTSLTEIIRLCLCKLQHQQRNKQSSTPPSLILSRESTRCIPHLHISLWCS